MHGTMSLKFLFQVFGFVDGAYTGVYKYQVRYRCCVDRITSSVKCSQTQLLCLTTFYLIVILFRTVYSLMVW